MKTRILLNKINLIKFLLILATSLLISNSCRKESFEEPQDPYENERLDAKHASIIFGEGPNALEICTNYENIDTTEKGNLRIRGTLYHVNSKYGPVKITQGDFLLLKGSFTTTSTVSYGNYKELPVSPGKFKYINSENAEISFQGFTGYSELNMPKVGILQNFNIATSLLYGMKIGYVKGDQLEGWPVASDRYYFYMTTVNLIDASAADGKVNFSLGYTQCALQKLAIDVTDPYVYARVDVEKFGGQITVLKEAGLGLSVQGNIPFRVPDDNKFGKVKDFDGQLLMEAKIDVKDLVAELPLPFLIDGQIVYAFDKSQPNAGAEFLDSKKVPFMMGGLGVLTVDATGGYVPGLSLEIELGNSAYSVFYKDTKSWETSFSGVVKYPPMQPRELIADILKTDPNTGFFKYLKFTDQSTIERKMWGTFGSDPSRWEYGWSLGSELKILGFDYFGTETMLEFNTNHLFISQKIKLMGFADAGMEGEIQFNGNLRLYGWVSAHKELSAGPLSLKIDFDVNALLAVGEAGFDFQLHGRFYGRACADILLAEVCISLEIQFDATVNSKGEFTVYAKLGIDGVGFSVKIHFDSNKTTKDMETIEVPIDSIPLNQRYYSDDYLLSHPQLVK